MKRDVYNDKSGATAVEYGLIVALIAMGIVAALTLLSGNISLTMDNVGDRLVEASTTE